MPKQEYNKSRVERMMEESKRAYATPEDYQKGQYDDWKDVFDADPELEIEIGMPCNREGWTLV